MKPTHRRPIQVFLPLLPPAVALLLLGAVLWAADRVVGQELAGRAGTRVEQAAALYADQLSRVLSRRAAELDLLAQMTRLDPRPETWRAQLQRLKVSTPSYVWIGITDAEGRVIAGTDGLLEGNSIAQRPVFANAREAPWFGSLHPPIALRPVMAQRAMPPPPRELADVAVPIRDAQGQSAGVLAAHLDGSYFEQLRQQVLGAGDARGGLELTLATPDGTLVLGPQPGLPDAAWKRLFSEAPAVHQRLPDQAGRAHLLAHAATRPVDTALKPGWHVVAWQPLDAALRPLATLERLLLAWGLLAALVIGAAGYALARRLTRPYSEMLDAVALRLGSAAAVSPGVALGVITEQLRRLPASHADDAPGEQLLAQVVHDANRLQVLLEHLPAPVYLLDEGFRVVFWNRACERVFGWTAAEAVGRTGRELMRPAFGDTQLQSFRERLAREPGPWQIEAEVLHRDGSSIWGEWQISRVFGIDGAPIGLLAQVRDRTAERQAESRLRDQAEMLAAVIDSASDAIVGADLQGRVTLFNPAAARIFGRPAEYVIGHDVDMLVPHEQRAANAQWLQRLAASNDAPGPVSAGRIRGLRADGSLLELEASISRVTLRDQKLLTAILRDVTDRVRAEQALTRYQLELSELTQRLLDQEKLASRRLAQMLHDQLGQTLGAIRLTFDTLEPRLAEPPTPRTQERARALGFLIDQAIQQVREALVELRPPMLEDSGLQAALDNEVRMRAMEAEPARLQLQIDPAAAGRRWAADVEYAAFMVAREAIGNAMLHAQARQIVVSLGGNGETLRLSVRDDGVGIADETVQGRPGHLGIVGMRERALAIGARLRVRRLSEGGTLVTLSWNGPPDSLFGALGEI